MHRFDDNVLLWATHHNCSSTYQNYHRIAIPAKGGRVTQVPCTSSNFFGCLPCACITYLLSWWSHFIYSHDNTSGLGELWDYLSTFLMLLHNSHLHVNWGGCYIATGGWQAQPMVCAARGALGVLQWEQQTPSSLPARAARSWSEGWWILRRFGLEAVIPLGVM